jgi:cytochrome c5
MRICRLAPFIIALAACQPQAGPAREQADADTSQSGLAPDVQRRLVASAMIALPPAGLTPESLPDPTSRGAQLLAGYCTQCHNLPSPATHAAQDWPSVARRMWVRIDMMHGELGVSVPAEADRVQLLTYLIAHAFPVAEQLPAGRGSAVFQAMCSRCHLLPDPRQHSPADWPAVVMRMERNMERMKVRGLTNDQATAIVGYLQGASRRQGDGR